jgi:polyhydroxybutyrate depolymerase
MSAVYEPYANDRAAVDPQGTVREVTTTTPDGRVRRYRTYVPASLVPGTKVPLLVALHGGLGWGEQFETNSGFDGLAESNQFIVVYPDGSNAQDGSQKLLTWNGGMCCGPAAAQNVDDVGFIAQVIEELSASLPIDQRRVSATGHSNGAILAYRLACELSDRISSIGVQAGVLGVPCAPAQPVSVFHLHGLADTNIPIDGGKGAGVSGVEFPSPREAPNSFAMTTGCTQGPIEQRDPENPDVVALSWAGCSDSRAVQFVTVAGASHAWMGHSGVTAASTSLVGIPYQGLDASRAIWSFLAVQPPR